MKSSISTCKKCKYYWGYDSGKPICGRYVITRERKNSPIGQCNDFEAGPHIMELSRNTKNVIIKRG